MFLSWVALILITWAVLILITYRSLALFELAMQTYTHKHANMNVVPDGAHQAGGVDAAWRGNVLRPRLQPIRLHPVEGCLGVIAHGELGKELAHLRATRRYDILPDPSNPLHRFKSACKADPSTIPLERCSVIWLFVRPHSPVASKQSVSAGDGSATSVSGRLVETI